eukprot:2261100-Pyramimonas_sp.AAC.1
MRRSVESATETIRSLGAKTEQLLQLATVRQHEEEGERRGLPGFELMGDRLNEYKTLHAEVRNGYKHVYGEVEFIKQSWQHALKHDIKVGARSVQPQRAIAAKRKLHANTSRWTIS